MLQLLIHKRFAQCWSRGSTRYNAPKRNMLEDIKIPSIFNGLTDGFELADDDENYFLEGVTKALVLDSLINTQIIAILGDNIKIILRSSREILKSNLIVTIKNNLVYTKDALREEEKEILKLKKKNA